MCSIYNRKNSKRFYSNVSCFESKKIDTEELLKMISRMSSGSSTSDGFKEGFLNFSKNFGFFFDKINSQNENS